MSMFGDVNKVLLMGNVTNDPDLRFTPSGSAVLNFGLATNRRYNKDDEWVDDVTFHNIVVWRSAESLAQRIKKGTRVFIEGRIQVRTWENDNGKQYKTEIVADDVNLIARYEGSNSDDAPSDSESKSSSSKPAPAKTLRQAQDNKKGEDEDNSIDPDDLPF